MLGEKFRDALKIELIGCAGKRVRLSRILEIFDLFAGRLEAIEQVTRPFVGHSLVGSAPVNLDRRADVVQIGQRRQSFV